FPFIDIDRVGIFGHSGGGFMSAAAMLQKPYNEFFKAAVASSGNHDNNIYNDNWSEHYHGLKEVVVKQEGAKKVADSDARGASEVGGAVDPDEVGVLDDEDPDWMTWDMYQLALAMGASEPRPLDDDKTTQKDQGKKDTGDEQQKKSTESQKDV